MTRVKSTEGTGYAAIGLCNPKNMLNVGSVLRAAYCFNATMIAISGKRYAKQPTDTPKAYRHIPLLQVDHLRNVIPYDCIPVAVELHPDASSLLSYTHPERAFYIFGAEDATLGKSVLKWCKDLVYIPTQHSLNLAASVHIVLYDRLTKQEQPQHLDVESEIPVSQKK